MTPPQSFEKTDRLSHAPSGSRAPFRGLLPLLILTAVLLVFIAWLGDWRRRHNVQTLMTRQATDYASLTTDAGLLPLNLSPSLPLDPPSRIVDAWLSPDDARTLRGTDHEVMVAWTFPLVRALGRNERAVIFFHQGRFEVRWLPLRQFDAQFAKQIAKVKHLAP